MKEFTVRKITTGMLFVIMVLSIFFSTGAFAANVEIDDTATIDNVVETDAVATTNEIGVEYRGHVENKGDMPVGETNFISGPGALGTRAQCLRVEGFMIKLTSDVPEGANIVYEVHVQNEGWMKPVKNGDFAGTRAKCQRVESIKINLENLPGYDVYYRGHVQDRGDIPQVGGEWGWVKNGEELGTTASSLRLEELQVKIVKHADVTYAKAGTFGPKTGVEVVNDNVTIDKTGVVLQNMHIKGNLTIGEGVGEGDVTLNNVIVDGNTYVQGGGKNSIHINGGEYHNIIVEQTSSGQTRIVAVGTDGLKVVISEDAKGEDIILEGAFDSVKIDAPNVKISTQGDTKIKEFDVAAGATGSQVTLDSKTTVDKLVLDEKTEMKGQGTVKEADVNKDGVTFEKAPDKQDVGTGVVAPVVTPPVVPPVTPPSSGGGTSDTTKPVVTAGAVNRSSDISATVKFTSNEAGKYYISVVNKGASAPIIDTSGAGTTCSTAEATITVILTAGEKDVYVAVKDSAGNVSTQIKIEVPSYVELVGNIAVTTPTTDGTGSGATNIGKYSVSSTNGTNPNYETTITANQTLIDVTSADLNQGTAKWVGVLITTDKDVKNIAVKTSSMNSFANLTQADINEAVAGGAAANSTNTFVWWLKAENMSVSKDILIKVKDEADSTAVKLTVDYEGPDITKPVMTALNAVLDNNLNVSAAGNPLSLTLGKGTVTKQIIVTMSEEVSITAGAVVTISGNGIPTGTQYGTIAEESYDKRVLIITPDGTNGQAALEGAVTFTVAANAIKDTANNGNDETNFILNVVNDITKPVLTAGEGIRGGVEKALFTFTSDEDGWMYFTDVEAGAAAPTINTDQSTDGQCFKGELMNPTTLGFPSEARDIYLVVKDALGNVSDPIKLSVPAYSIATDKEAPHFCEPCIVDRTSDTAATISFAADEDGQYYIGVVDAGEDVPTIDTTKPGKNCNKYQLVTENVQLSAGAKYISVVLKDASGNIGYAWVNYVDEYLSSDITPPTASVVQSGNTITYTFNEPVELRNNDGSLAELTKDKLGIYVVSNGDYGIDTKTTNEITEASLNTEKTVLTIKYSGTLAKQTETSYVVDAWGYRITDGSNNKVLPSATQIFKVAADTTPPTASVVQTGDTITYTFNEPVELRNNDGSLAELTKDKLGIYVVSNGDYGIDTKTTNEITEASLNTEKTVLTIKYSGTLAKQTETSYVVDAWGYRITDGSNNKVLPSASQIFTVAADATKPAISKITARSSSGDVESVTSAPSKIAVDSGFVVNTIDIAMSEDVQVDLNTEVTMNFPTVGMPGYPSALYGTVTGVTGNVITITPNEYSKTATFGGTFTFSLPDNAVKDLAGNGFTGNATLIVNSLAAEIASAKDYTYESSYAYVGNTIYDGATMTFTAEYTQAQYTASAAMNDMARYLGALHRQNNSSIVEISYNGTAYTWNSNGILQGSNWQDTSGNTLVSAIVTGIGSYEPNTGIVVTVSDGFNTADVALKFAIK